MNEELDVVMREDGSWLMDGGVAVEQFKSVLEMDEDLPGEEENAFNTLGGFVMHVLGHPCRDRPFRLGRLSLCSDGYG